MANIPADIPIKSLDGDNNEACWFPSDLEAYKYHITFDFRTFTRRDITDRSFWAPGEHGSVRLPIPANMIDTTAARWSDEAMNPILGSIIDIGARLNTEGSAFNLREQFRNALTLGGASVASLLGRAGGVQAALGLVGVRINPFMTVMFQSPTFKRHQFQWHMHPHSQEETDTLRKILARFRFHMLPSVRPNTAGILLNYPNMCYVSLHPNNKDLYKFKPCVIESASINYAPNGPSFFRETEAPTGVVLTLDLLELEYWIQEDVSATWDKKLEEGGMIEVQLPGGPGIEPAVNPGVAPTSTLNTPLNSLSDGG